MAPHAEALIVVDLQRAFVSGPDAIPDANRVATAVHRLLTLARDAGALVVHLQNDGQIGTVDEPGSSGWALAWEPLDGEPVIRKRNDDGFLGTGLEAMLGERGVRAVVVCGVQSEMCVAATARAALARGLAVMMTRDSHGTYAIPAQGDTGVAVPAAHVARVAEWSLGDEVVTVDRCDEVSFLSATPYGDSP